MDALILLALEQRIFIILGGGLLFDSKKSYLCDLNVYIAYIGKHREEIYANAVHCSLGRQWLGWKLFQVLKLHSHSQR